MRLLRDCRYALGTEQPQNDAAQQNVKLKENDVVDAIHDMGERTIRFKVNGEMQPNGFNDINQDIIYPYVEFASSSYTVEVLGCSKKVGARPLLLSTN